MADPLSITGLVLSIACLVSSLQAYFDTVKSARDDIRRLSHELFALKGAFEFVQSLNCPQFANSAHLDSVLASTDSTLRLLRSKLDAGQKQTLSIRSLIWPFKKPDIDKYVGTLERAKTLATMLVMGDTAELVTVVYQDLQRLATLVEQDTAARAEAASLRETGNIIAWLAPADSAKDQLRAEQARTPGTGEWFFDDAFHSWSMAEPKQQFWWISGKTGSGKTTLFASVARKLRVATENRTRCICCFHYCSSTNEVSQPPSSIFGTVLSQVLRLHPEFFERIQAARSATSRYTSENKLDIDQIQELLQHALSLYDRFYILVDAINETPYGSQVTNLLISLCDGCPQLRVLVTTIHDPPETHVGIAIRRLAEVGLASDIERYVEHRLAMDSSFSRLSGRVKEAVREKLARGSDGMFRWAHLGMERLSTFRTGKTILQALDQIPDTLNETYSDILDRTTGQDRHLAREALKWVCFSLTPMTLAELGDAIVLEEGDAEIDQDSRLTDPVVILDVCQGLVEVANNRLKLAHDSVRLFLTSEWIKTSRAKDFALDPTTSHREIIRSCLTYLNMWYFQAGPCSTRPGWKERLRLYPLLDYAARVWPLHCRTLELSEKEEAAILSFFDTKNSPNGGAFDSWIQILLLSTDLDAVRQTHPLYYAASYNMVSIIKLLIKSNPALDIDRRGGRYSSTPLYVTLYRGHLETARVLVEAGANCQLPELDHSDTPLDMMMRAVRRKLPGPWESLRQLAVRKTYSSFQGLEHP